MFQYKSGNKEGWGRCWVYKVSDSTIFATNFYSCGFEIKSHSLKYPLVRALRLLFGMSEEVRFAYSNIDLPIYLNNDGLIIYEKGTYSISDEVIEEAGEIKSECMECGAVVRITDLYRSDVEWYYGDKKVKGLIVCEDCIYKIENSTICAGCEGIYYIDDMYHYSGDEYFCVECFNERFEYCCVCNEFDWRENMIVDRYGNWLCSDCVDEHRRQCDVCGEYVYPEDVRIYEVLTYNYIDDKYVCDKCEKDYRWMKCEKCGYEFYYSEKEYREYDKIREIVRAGICPVCYESENKENLTLSSDPFKQILSMENVIVQD